MKVEPEFTRNNNGNDPAQVIDNSARESLYSFVIVTALVRFTNNELRENDPLET